MATPINLSKKTSTSKSTKTLKNTKAVKSTKVIKSTKTLKSSDNDSSSLTICTENNFDDSKREEQNPLVKKVKFNGWKHEIFSYKEDAIKYIENQKDPELKLFCEDMRKNSGCKDCLLLLSVVKDKNIDHDGRPGKFLI